MLSLPSLKNLAVIHFSNDPLARLAKIEAEIGEIKGQEERLAERKAELEAQRKEVVDTLKSQIAFEQILPESQFKNLHDQLRKNERVHPLDTTEELVRMRIGDEYANKRCFARVKSEGQQVVTTGIFTGLVTVENTHTGMSYDQIPGDIGAVKNMPVETFVAPNTPNNTVVAVLYTISNSEEHGWERGGRALAEQVYQYLHHEAQERGYNLVISTLSPVRNFAQYLSQKAGFQQFFDENGKANEEFSAFLKDEGNQKIVRQFLMEYLVSQKDPVLNFHLGNGAYIGDLKFNPDEPEDWAMVNYVYPSDVTLLKQNQEIYKSQKRKPIAPHLQSELSDIALKMSTYPILYPNTSSMTAIPAGSIHDSRLDV